MNAAATTAPQATNGASTRSDLVPAGWRADRLAGICALAGALVMLTGAVLHRILQASGTDLDAALTDGEMAGYLDAAAGDPLVVANLSLWLVGAPLMAAAGIGFASLSRHRPGLAGLGLASALVGAAVAVIAFTAWLSLAVAVGPTGDAGLGTALGWFALRADWVATILIVGLPPLLYGLAGRGTWAPTWLVWLGAAAALASVLTVVALFTNELGTYGFVLVPLGLLWIIAAGLVALRQTPSSA